MKNTILEPLSFYPKRSGPYKYSGFSVFGKKTSFFKFGSDGFSGGAREGPETCVGALEISKEALEKVNQVQGGPFWKVLDRQKFARARFLIEQIC